MCDVLVCCNNYFLGLNAIVSPAGRLWGPIVVGTTASSTVLGVAFAIIYVIGNRSLNPAIAAHAVIDMVVEPGMILMAAMAGAVH